MSTLAEKQEANFRDEHNRLLRALFESIEKESTLIREIRQMKESLVAVALRLQVSYQINEMDEKTINELRKEVSDARMSALSANKQFSEAADVILSLKREISSLKRQMKDVRNTDLPNPNAPPQLAMPGQTHSTGSPTPKAINLGGQSSFGQQADADVDKMMAMPLYKPTLGAGGKPLNSPIKSSQTPFQEWKMQQYVYAPDTMQGSRNHDPLVVQLLNAATMKASQESRDAFGLFDRTTKSTAAKGHAPDSKEAIEARELAESLEGLNLPAMHRKTKKAKEKGTKNIWGLNPPERLLSRDPIALKRLGSPVQRTGNNSQSSVLI